ncbi:glycosyltransferase family 4 protein [Pedobacter cryophilus]|uniref:Glycosyltransferase family 4 protein n=1 Tax=Pedobacter cryophilus TaxID=2571271 RepID=A0A4U1BT66_9SPHI|nr:glycosyltransferase family 4 protein [Pedobacter cryophilus]TKB95573.1 glycosyltransferase family 4 protein [Pedobacter cryophilus]
MRVIQQVLIIGTVWPEPNSSAAGSRMMQLIKSFVKKGWKITFASAAADSDFMVDLTTDGIEKVSIKLNDASFDEFIKALKPDLVLFDRFMTEEQFGWRVSENCPHALKVLDTEDLHCLRTARQKAWKIKKDFKLEDLLDEDVAKREIASILRCDLSLIISTYEMKVLVDLFNVDETLLMYLPFMLPQIVDADRENWLAFEEREHFITIGNFLHEPNYQAVIFLKNEIWPTIRKKLPEAQMHIYGAYPSEKVNQLNNPKDGFLVKGRVRNVKDVMVKAKVCLAPLVFGAGLKGKLIDAMQSGTPNVTTHIGAEAMHNGLPWGGYIANQPKDFADDAVKLYTNETVWTKFQQNGVEVINQIFDEKHWDKELIETLNHVKENILEHRKANFMGAILQHHTLMSTKYMSKWIEEKNK